MTQEIQILVTVEVERDEGTAFTERQIRDAAVQSIHNLVRTADDHDLFHDLSKQVAIQVSKVEPMPNYEVLREPLSNAELILASDGEGDISVVVPVNLSEIGESADNMLDVCCRKIGSMMLNHLDYSIVGHEGETTLHIRIDANTELVDIDQEDWTAE